ACYLTHSSIEAALHLRDQEKVEAEKIEQIEVLVPRGHLDVCNISEPSTGLEGKFSLRATVAMALVGVDTTDTRVFTDEQMRDPALLRLRDVVTVTPSQEVSGTQSKVSVRLPDGNWLYAAADTGVPATDYELQWERLTGKFIGLAAPVIGEARAWEVHAYVHKLEELKEVGLLLALVREP
ncbi:MAG: MmgE/PrpD family protein, partial [Acidimicrobiia bacterium]